MKPAAEAIAFRIWAFANPLGWNVTAEDVAAALGVPRMTVLSIAYHKGWTTRFRVRVGRRRTGVAAANDVETTYAHGLVPALYSTGLSDLSDLTGAAHG